jgi:ABC-type branched-subunit amino acid transport system permease subunit
MKQLFDPTVTALIAGYSALLIGGGLFGPEWVLNLLILTFSYGLAASVLMLLWRSGLVSFGHALFFGVGAYTCVFANRYGVRDAVVVALAGAASAGLIGFLLGFVLRRYRGIFFAMLNLAFSMMLYGLVVKSDALGSTDGFGVLRPTFFGIDVSPESSRRLLYVLIGAVTCMISIMLHIYLRTAMGALSTAVRDNEIRVDYLGYSPNKIIHINYTLSAIVTGLAGAFLALAVGQVDPDSMMSWTNSGELVFITILGGSGSVGAPLVGAFIFELLRTYAFELAPSAWRMIMGVVLVILILFVPDGLWSLHVKFRRSPRSPVEELA